MTYMICDKDGYAITDGVQDHEAHQVAQRIANARLESVYLSESASDGLGGEEVDPDRRNPIVVARQALDEWNYDDAPPAEITAVFLAIYEREPASDDDAVSDIYAAQDILTADEAVRVNLVLP